MTAVLTSTDLAALLKTKAGVSVDPIDLDSPGATFDKFGVDSLGMLGVLAELENRHGLSLDTADTSQSPAEFLNTVNVSLKEGA